MIEFIKYQQINATVPCADISTVFAPLDKPIWHEFTDMAITRTHAIDLFSGSKVLVCVKEGDTYITNSEAMRKTYRKGGHKAVLFSTLSPSNGLLREVGFLG